MRCPYCASGTWDVIRRFLAPKIRMKCGECWRIYDRVLLFDVAARRARYVVRPASDPKTGRKE